MAQMLNEMVQQAPVGQPQAVQGMNSAM